MIGEDDIVSVVNSNGFTFGPRAQQDWEMAEKKLGAVGLAGAAVFLAVRMIRKHARGADREPEVEVAQAPAKAPAKAPAEEAKAPAKAPAKEAKATGKKAAKANDSFTNVSELRDVLKRNGVDVDAWGQGEVRFPEFVPEPQSERSHHARCLGGVFRGIYSVKIKYATRVLHPQAKTVKELFDEIESGVCELKKDSSGKMHLHSKTIAMNIAR